MFTLLPIDSSLARDSWQDYVGNYQIDATGGKTFEDFGYFSFEPGTGWRYLDIAASTAYLIPPQDTGWVLCPMKEIHAQADSISFRTSECFGEQYTLNGRLLFPASQFIEHRGEEVVQGMLRQSKNGLMIKEGKVMFSWDDSGD